MPEPTDECRSLTSFQMFQPQTSSSACGLTFSSIKDLDIKVFIVHEPGRVVLVDVTMPFGSGSQAFQAARSNKRRQYGDLIRFQEAHGLFVTFEAIVVGSLGGWDTRGHQQLQSPPRAGHPQALLVQARRTLLFGRHPLEP